MRSSIALNNTALLLRSSTASSARLAYHRCRTLVPKCHKRANSSLSSRPGPLISNPIVRSSPIFSTHMNNDYSRQSTTALYRLLRSYNITDPKEFRKIVYVIIQERLEKPNVELYSGLFRACSCHETGSAGMVRHLIKEAHDNGIELDNWACECIYEVSPQ